MKWHFPVCIFWFLNRVCDSLVISAWCYGWWSVDLSLVLEESSLQFSALQGHRSQLWVCWRHSQLNEHQSPLVCVWNGGWSPSFRQLGQYWKPCGPWGGVSVWRRGGQGEGKRCGLLCSVCFKALILHRWLWASLRDVYIDFHSFSFHLFGLTFTSPQCRPAVNTEPLLQSFCFTPAEEGKTQLLFQFLSRFSALSRHRYILRTYLLPGWEDKNRYLAAIPLSCFIVRSCPMRPLQLSVAPAPS